MLYAYITMHCQQDVKNELQYVIVLHVFVSVLACPALIAARSECRGA